MADPKLVARLEADIRKFERQLERADELAKKMTASTEKRFEHMAGQINSHMTKLAGVFAGALSVGALSSAIRTFTKAGSDIGTVSQQLGISAEKLQELQHAIRLAGGETAEFDKSMLFLARAVADADAEVTDVSRSINKLGLTMAELRGLSPDAMLRVIADRFAKLANPVIETQVATALFGDELGQKMIPLLKKGATGLAEAAAEARKYGLIVSEGVIKETKEASQELARLDAALRSAGISLATTLNPAVTRLRELMTDPEFQRGLQKIANAIIAMVELAGKNPELIAGLIGALGGAAVGRIAGPLGAIGGGALGAGAAVNALRSDLEKVDNEIESIDGRLARLRDTDKNALAIGALQTWMDVGKRIRDLEAERATLIEKRTALEKKAAEAAKAAAAVTPEPTKVTVQALDPFKQISISADVAKAVEEITIKAKLAGAEFTGWNEQLKELLLRLEPGRKAVQALGGDLSKWPENIQKANVAFERMTRMQEVKSAAKEFSAAWTKAIEDAIFEAKSLGDAARQLAKDIAKLILRLLVLKPLEKALEAGFTGAFAGIGLRAMGGPVSAGAPYLVGEQGPELFVPRAGGRIIPNAKLAGGGGSVSIGGSTVVVQGSAGTREIVLIQQALKSHEQRIAATHRALVSQNRLQATGVM